MSNSLYQSLLSRLSIIAPLFAKTILDQAIFKRGKTTTNIAAIDLLEILRTEINPKLSRNELKTNALMQAGSGFIIYDTHEQIVFLSPMIKKMLSDLKADDKNLFSQLLNLSLCRPIPEVSQLVAFEIELKQLGQTFDISIAPIFDHDMKITGAISLVRDITLKVAIEDEVITQSRLLREEILAREKAQKDLELNQEQLIQNSKLASLGEMAGGIAHEINNPLAVVLGGVELMELQSKRDILDHEKLKAGIERIKMASLRIKNTVEAMRTLSREGNKEEMSLYPVDKLLTEVLSLCQEKISGAGVKLVIENNLHDIEIACRPIELGQVFINLLNNSFDAISELKEKLITIRVSQKNHSVIISFIDSGHGIPLEIEKRMFDPFYTTKPIGKGVGIGMSISKKIIEMHQGTIQVDRKSPNTKIDIVMPIKQG